MDVGFLPYIPHPVTEYATVHTALINFLSVLTQLHQEAQPHFRDEVVYRILVDIYVPDLKIQVHSTYAGKFSYGKSTRALHRKIYQILWCR